MSRLQNKVAVVTGASSGIGRATALAFAAQGTKLVICADLKPNAREEIPEEAAITTHELIEKQYGAGKAKFIQTNATKPEDVQACINEAVKAHGRLDIIFNNVGGGPHSRSLIETKDEDWDVALAVNLRSTFLGMKYACAQFVKQDLNEDGERGVVVNTASVSGLVGCKGIPASYGAAKAGVINLTKTVALEHATDKIRCNAICPGGVTTAATKDYLETNAQYWSDMMPLMASIPPSKIAPAAVFLASAEASAITGVQLPVDAGFTMH